MGNASKQLSEAKDKLDAALAQAEETLRTSGDQQKIAALSVCDDVLATLRKMETSLVDGVKEGLIDICNQIAAEQTAPGSPERTLLNRIARSTEGLTEAITETFEQHCGVVQYQRSRFLLGKIAGEAG